MRAEGILYRHGREFKADDIVKIRRLSVSCMGPKLVLPDQIIRQGCLRTNSHGFLQNQDVFEDSVLKTLSCLRVLDLTATSIENIPDCIGDLLHLRYLDFDGTNIREIPTSIGNLVNLRSLNISKCKFLERLPVSISKLHNLRWLDMTFCPLLTYVPKGIGKLENFYCLEGFMVGQNDSANEEGCDLEELKNLSELRVLSIYRLERAERGASALANKPFLNDLMLGWMRPGGTAEGEEQISKAERICNEMAQPLSTLVYIHFYEYPGRQFPSWMATSSLAESFPDLTYLGLLGLPCCTELPPLGTLPQLKYLRIDRARAMTAIGSQFLGSRGSAFPKLERLIFIDMPQWEEWTFNGALLAVKLFPSLRKCLIVKCPKLRALPDDLHRATNLHELYLRQAYGLSEINNLPLAYKLEVTNGRGLKKISNIPLLRYLEVGNCPNLECVENLDKLQHLVLICSEETEQLPQWFQT
ncbi:putative disease resistance protein At3g14460 [Zingiber officinale]|uniref:Disease resistance R13L4/SHOC-2-like LRR domain-containing protein n=1 Tax=Zingiber officinale TaxID=94328 RepID=A0A8J5GX80_ZINOF|nr:putative disease resistance protein At3g14460 [Zingiber officinale]KAG6515860.1 hypothetical protein ZIOFF_026294 [Zingiber officinale]